MPIPADKRSGEFPKPQFMTSLSIPFVSLFLWGCGCSTTPSKYHKSPLKEVPLVGFEVRGEKGKAKSRGKRSKMKNPVGIFEERPEHEIAPGFLIQIQ